jgi:hypothetical protein
MQKHLRTDPTNAQEDTVGAHKHKKKGYQLFKDKFVKQVVVKADVKKGNEQQFFLVKGCVDASMKKTSYVVYVHLNQVTGEIDYANCMCRAGKGGCCSHVVALLFQLLEYRQLDLQVIPDDLTCTELLQQWHVPKNEELKEAILYEDVVFRRASYEKDKKGKKRKNLKTCDNINNPEPQYSQGVTQEKIQGLVSNLKESQKASYLCKLLESNQCQPFGFEEAHSNLPSKKKCLEAKENACDLNDSNLRDEIMKKLEPAVVNMASIPEDSLDMVKDLLNKNHAELLEIERNTRGQAECEKWFEERNKRVTSSNFGAVIKRRKSCYPKSILKKILESKTDGKKGPKSCLWGHENERRAVDEYFKLRQKQAYPVKICTQVGFVINPVFPWLGASPDFLIEDTKETSKYGIGEIKCPFSK